MRPVLIGLLAIVALAGCAATDRTDHTTFWKLSDDHFQVDAKTTIFYPESSALAEEARMAWIADWLRLNAMCPDGFEIEDRAAIVIVDNFLGTAHRITYLGRCV